MKKLYLFCLTEWNWFEITFSVSTEKHRRHRCHRKVWNVNKKLVCCRSRWRVDGAACFTWRKEASDVHNFLPLRYSSSCQRSALMATTSRFPWNVFYKQAFFSALMVVSMRSIWLSAGMLGNVKQRGALIGFNDQSVTLLLLRDKKPPQTSRLTVCKNLKAFGRNLADFNWIWISWEAHQLPGNSVGFGINRSSQSAAFKKGPRVIIWEQQRYSFVWQVNK